MSSISGLWVLALAALAVAVVAVIVATLLRRRVLARSTLDDTQVNAIRAELLDAVKEASRELGTRVTLDGFWRSSGLNRGDRYRIVQPMIDQHVLRSPDQSDALSRGLSQIASYSSCALPPSAILNSRDWWRMTRGESAVTLIGEQWVDYHPSTVTTTVEGSGSAQVTVAGGDADTEATNIRLGEGGISPDQVARLAQALRHDAVTSTPEAAAELHKAADELDAQQSSRSPSQERLRSLFQKVSSFSKMAVTGMKATKDVLDAVEGWQN